MGRLWGRKPVLLILPGVLVFLFMFIALILYGEFTFLKGTEALWKICLRLLRLSFTVIVPLAFLPVTCSILSRYYNRGNRSLVIVRSPGSFPSPVRMLFQRPLQGSALSMIFATRLISFLQLSGGTGEDPLSVIQDGGFSPGRFMAATAIGMAASLVLTTAWALDDLNVRSRNLKQMEVLRPGRAAGTMLPFLFGIFGVFQLFSSYPFENAMSYTMQILMTLYSPFLFLSVIHSFYVARKREGLMGRLGCPAGTCRWPRESGGRNPEQD